MDPEGNPQILDPEMCAHSTRVSTQAVQAREPPNPKTQPLTREPHLDLFFSKKGLPQEARGSRDGEAKQV